jgi:hypothetical protein
MESPLYLTEETRHVLICLLCSESAFYLQKKEKKKKKRKEKKRKEKGIFHGPRCNPA